MESGERKVTNFRYADDTTLMSEEEEDLRLVIERVKEESEKAGLQLNVKKTKIMTNQGLVEFQIVPGVKLETVNSFDFLGSRIDTTWYSCSEIRRRLGMGRNAIASLRKLWGDSDLTISTKRSLIATLIFPIVTYGCES